MPRAPLLATLLACGPARVDEQPDPATTSSSRDDESSSDGRTDSTGASESTAGSTGDVTGEASTTSGESASTDATGDVTGASTTSAAVCGDGTRAPGEECDDGEANSDAGACLEDCTAAACGDGKVYIGAEACDDGNDDNTDACLDTCTLPSCGDGFVQAGEACDDGNASDADACTSSCSANVCGDGVLNPEAEECDDGNSDAGDGCGAACAVELVCGKTFTLGWCKQVGPTEQYTRCGDVTDAGRTCINPLIKYGTNTGGVPQALGAPQYVSDSLDAWCQQLGFAGWSGALETGDRACLLPGGPLAWSSLYDEKTPHWGETGGGGNNGYWKGPGQKLNEANWPCEPGQAIMWLTCI